MIWVGVMELREVVVVANRVEVPLAVEVGPDDIGPPGPKHRLDGAVREVEDAQTQVGPGGVLKDVHAVLVWPGGDEIHVELRRCGQPSGGLELVVGAPAVQQLHLVLVGPRRRRRLAPRGEYAAFAVRIDVEDLGGDVGESFVPVPSSVVATDPRVARVGKDHQGVVRVVVERVADEVIGKRVETRPEEQASGRQRSPWGVLEEPVVLARLDVVAQPVAAG